MHPDLQILPQGARQLGIDLTAQQIASFDLYQRELLKWNAKVNLISAGTAGEIVTRHFLDSLTAAQFLSKQNIRLVDIGCGAGFPGIPLKIALPSLKLCLLEANRKKVSFLQHIIRLLHFDDTFILHDRTENIIRTDIWREKFDVAISRASLKLPALLPLGNYFLAGGGLLITLKGQDVSAELNAALAAGNASTIYQLFQYDINMPLLGPPRKIIIFQKKNLNKKAF